jgi:hypothetical protein
MRSRGTRARLLALAPILAALAACGGDGGSGPDRLTPQQVGGVYQVCSLVFTPQGGSPPPLDIRAAAMETSGGAVRELALGRTVSDFSLEYTRKGDVLKRRFEGGYDTGTRSVSLSFDNASEVAGSLLLPRRLQLDYDAARGVLEVSSAHSFHNVSRANYERLSGQSFPNSRDQITGTLSGRFAPTCN